MQKYLNLLIKHRRNLHQIPELSFQEHKTSQYLKETLSSFGVFEIKKFAVTGLTAAYTPIKGADYLAVRADMDALPVTELTGLSCESLHKGTMHACGHDLHMAILLTLAEYIHDTKPAKNILLILQPAEEGHGGAERMLAEGLLEQFKIGEIYALHNTCEYPVGTIALNNHKMFAGTVEFKITLAGQGGHAAFYHLLNDLNVAASTLVMMLTSIPSRMINPNHEAIVSIGHMGGEGGPAANILPEKYHLHGTVRSFYPDDLLFIKKKIKDMVKAIALAYGIETDLTVISEYLPVINHPLQADKIFALNNQNGLQVIECEQKMTGEDFGFFTAKIPGAIFWLGTANQEAELNLSLHNSAYNPNEAGMQFGFEAMRMLLDI